MNPKAGEGGQAQVCRGGPQREKQREGTIHPKSPNQNIHPIPSDLKTKHLTPNTQHQILVPTPGTLNKMVGKHTTYEERDDSNPQPLTLSLIHLYIHIHIHIHIHICIYINIYICIYAYMYLHSCVCKCLCICMYVYTFTYMCICM